MTPRSFFALALAAVCLAGCGGNGNFNFRGKVVRGGAPFTVPKEETVRVTFYEQTADGKMGNNAHIATYDNTAGTFRVVGRDGSGLPPGKYKVTVEHEKKRKDQFRGAFDADRSRFVFDINPSSPEIVIDLDKK